MGNNRNDVHLPSWFNYNLAGKKYWEAGHHLHIHALSLLDDEIEGLLDEASNRLDEIADAKDAKEWLDKYFPNFVKAVPEDDRDAFVDGFLGLTDE